MGLPLHLLLQEVLAQWSKQIAENLEKIRKEERDAYWLVCCSVLSMSVPVSFTFVSSPQSWKPCHYSHFSDKETGALKAKQVIQSHPDRNWQASMWLPLTPNTFLSLWCGALGQWWVSAGRLISWATVQSGVGQAGIGTGQSCLNRQQVWWGSGYSGSREAVVGCS